MKQDDTAATQRAVFVLGMHRSGTSATAGVLHYAGVDFGNRLLPGKADNPKGFFEHEEIWHIHETLLNDLGSGWDDIRPLPLGWLDTESAQKAASRLADIVDNEFSGLPMWGLKDPRLSRLFQLWRPILEERSITPLVVLALRHPLEVAQSLQRRDKIGLSHGLAVWLRYTMEAERSTREFRRVTQYYPRLISDWRAELRRMSNALSLGIGELPAARQIQVDGFIDRDLRHERRQRSMTDYGVKPPLAEWCMSVYETIKSLDEKSDTQHLDRIADDIFAFEQKIEYYSQFAENYVKSKIHEERSKAWLGQQVENMNDEIKRLEGLNRDISERKNYEINRLRTELEYVKIDVKDRDMLIRQIYDSTSWKITEPLRTLKRMLL